MSLLFSNITVRFNDGRELRFWESGHPDEYDLRELFQYEPRYSKVRDNLKECLIIQVCYYRFGTHGREWLAEQDHFALMDAYDRLAEKHREKDFLHRRDVRKIASYQFRLRPHDVYELREEKFSSDSDSCKGSGQSGSYSDQDFTQGSFAESREPENAEVKV